MTIWFRWAPFLIQIFLKYEETAPKYAICMSVSRHLTKELPKLQHLDNYLCIRVRSNKLQKSNSVKSSLSYVKRNWLSYLGLWKVDACMIYLRLVPWICAKKKNYNYIQLFLKVGIVLLKMTRTLFLACLVKIGCILNVILMAGWYKIAQSRLLALTSSIVITSEICRPVLGCCLRDVGD